MADKPDRFYQQHYAAVRGCDAIVSPAFEFCMAFRAYREEAIEHNKAPTEESLKRLQVCQGRMDEAWLVFAKEANKRTEVLVGPKPPEPKPMFGGPNG